MRLGNQFSTPRLLAGIALLLGFALQGCSTVGVNRADVRPSEDGSFDQALIDYAVGDLDQAQVGSLAAIESNPLDARATDLLRAILKEKNLIEELKPAPAVALPEFQPQTPAQLVRIIRGRSPAVREAVYAVIEARASLREANADVGPELTLLTRFYPLGILARMTQSIYGGWWERKAKMNAAEAEIVEALANYGRVTETVNKDALLAYIAAAAAQDRMTHIDRERALLDDQFEQASLLVSDGLSLPRAPLVARDEIGSLMHERSLAEQQLATSKAQLNALMNRPPTAPIVISAHGVSWQPSPSVDAALTAAYVNRFELDEADARIKTAQAQKALAASRAPAVDLYTSYGESEEKTEARFLKGFTVGAITRIPLAIVPLKKAREDQHEAIIRQLELREQQVRHDIAVEVVDAYHGWEAARSEFDSERNGLVLASEDRRVATAEHDAEVDTDPMALSRAQIEYVRAQRAVSQREFDVQRSLVELGASVGAKAGSMTFQPGSAPVYSGSVLPGSSGNGDGRAVWVWRKPFLKRPQDVQFFVDLLRVRRISTVFLFVNEGELTARAEVLGLLLKLAQRSGIAVHALSGKHEWLQPARHAEALRFVERVIAFNGGNPPASRFSAIHLDIEPHALEAWNNDARKESLLFSYIDLLDKLKTARKRIPVVVDVPLWFADREVEGILLSDVVMRRADGVAFMAYGTSAARRKLLIERVARSSATRTTMFWLGMSADHEHLCAGTGAEGFEADMHAVESLLDTKENFSGVAIHELDRYRELLLDRGIGSQTGKNRCLRASSQSPSSG